MLPTKTTQKTVKSNGLPIVTTQIRVSLDGTSDPKKSIMKLWFCLSVFCLFVFVFFFFLTLSAMLTQFAFHLYYILLAQLY